MPGRLRGPRARGPARESGANPVFGRSDERGQAAGGSVQGGSGAKHLHRGTERFAAVPVTVSGFGKAPLGCFRVFVAFVFILFPLVDISVFTNSF